MPAADSAKAALFAACVAGDTEEVQRLAGELETAGKDVRELRDANGASLLCAASQAGATEACRVLIDKLSFDINQPDGSGNTPLILALQEDHWATAEALLAAGADASRRGGGGEGAAAPLHLAAAAGQQELADKLLDAGADVNAESSSGTPLMLAAARDNVPLVEHLLRRGADVNVAPRQGLTALFMAAAVGVGLPCVRALIAGGADVNARALGSFTPLHVAAEGGKVELAQALLEAGADPQARDEHGHTPARVAAMHGHRPVVEALLARADADAASGSGGGSVDDFMAGAKADLAAREESAASAGTGGSVVAVPAPECPDEALSDTFKRKGNEFFVAGDYEGSAKLYGLALSHWTKNPVVWSNRAACHLRLGKFEKALQDAQVARSLDAKYVKAWYREGRAAEGLCRWEDAATAFYQAAQLQPDNEEFIQLTKHAIVEGRKALAAQQAADGGGGSDQAAGGGSSSQAPASGSQAVAEGSGGAVDDEGKQAS
ncbi:ankyrin repeat protein [Micractinium conductrix]|uniref:Ankyrin repeat protein n=1 Tax=Micractinium conductrix TaxID=554055 RepID=A0A2P6VHP6_9CHLO|nr:ankyrin repeat protein [Micractinium conductrix]|eukprot:PSC73598.1 ankyrin repeat protein [Micractinium conductrix]